MRFAAVALILVLGACGAGSDGPDPAASSAAPTVPAGVVPTTPAPTGDPAPAALSRFRCDPDGAGTFSASGVLANAAKKPTTFQVTVQVGPIDAPTQSARTKQVPKVAAGGSIEFEILKIPAPAEGGECHVQVLTTK